MGTVSIRVPPREKVSIFFWISIGLWVVALVAYALILNGNEQLERRDTRMSVFIPFKVLFQDSGYSRYSRLLYRTLILSAFGAMLSGGLFMLTGTF